MFEFQKLCSEVEALTPAESGLMLADRALSVTEGLAALNLQGINPVEVLASFIVGSVVSDGKISEKDLLNIHPDLVKALGDLCDIVGVERVYKVSKDVKKEIIGYTRLLQQIIAAADEKLAGDIVMLCLLITSADGKVSLKEKRYIMQLCNS